MTRSTLPNISESDTPLRLRGTFNELECGKVSLSQSGEENYLESNESRNIDFDLLSEINSVQFSAGMNIEMTQNKLFEILKRRVLKIEKVHSR